MSYYISVYGDGVDEAQVMGDIEGVASFLGRVASEAGSVHANIDVFEGGRSDFGLLFHCLDGACCVNVPRLATGQFPRTAFAIPRALRDAPLTTPYRMFQEPIWNTIVFAPPDVFVSVDEALGLLARVIETKGVGVDVVSVGQTFEGSGIPVPDEDPSWDQL
jgi:hypothetical protein